MTDASTPQDGAPAADRAADIRITGGSPDSAEVAAITAVLTVALEQLAAEHRRRGDDRRDAWGDSTRGMREPLRRGTWGSWI